MKLAALPVVLLLALAGCGSGDSDRAADLAGEIPTGILSEPSPATESCTIGDTSSGAMITVDAVDAAAACDELIRTLAEAGDFWRHEPVDRTRDVVCVVEPPGGAGTVTIRDVPSYYLGERFCASYVAEGWVDVGD